MTRAVDRAGTAVPAVGRAVRLRVEARHLRWLMQTCAARLSPTVWQTHRRWFKSCLMLQNWAVIYLARTVFCWPARAIERLGGINKRTIDRTLIHVEEWRSDEAAADPLSEVEAMAEAYVQLMAATQGGLDL